MSRPPLLPPDLDAPRARRELGGLFGVQLLAKLASYAVLALLARRLSLEAFGQFLFATSVALALIPLSDPGTRRSLLRDAAASPQRALDAFSAVLSLRLALGAPYLALVAAIGIARPEVLGALLLAGLFVWLRSLWGGTASALLQGLRRIGFTVLATGLTEVLLVVLVLALLAWGAGVEGVLAGHALTYGLLLGAGLVYVAARVGRFRLVWRRQELARVTRTALPFFVIDAFQVAHFKLDTLLLGLLRGYGEVALYESSARLLEASQFAMRPLLAIFLPICATLAAAGRWPELDRLVRGLLLRVGGLGVVLAAGVFAAAPWITVFVYGSAFEAAAPLLRVLYLSSPFLFGGFVLLFAVGAMHLERAAAPLALAALVGNVAADLVLIPRLGAAGAAASSVATQVLFALALVWLYRRGLRLRAASG